ncbi:MAG: helix-turn-helix transcriptional regulator [Clostridiales bacterium]|nr:helix-turn-helix transcriptional regulator [Clostridiales bacterium]
MFKHKAKDGTRNLCGKKVMMLRKALVPKVSQRQLAEMIQLHGVDIDKTAVKRIENGERYVTDIELKILSDIFEVTSDYFLKE